MSSIEREARKDAKEFARAQMFYGEGAGNRRKLITAKVEAKAAKSQAYARAFHSELSRQDMERHANLAQRERHLKDASHTVNKNLRGIVHGDYRSVNTGVIAALGVAYVAHQTGLDKKLYHKAKDKIDEFKARRAVKKMLRDDPRITVINPNKTAWK